MRNMRHVDILVKNAFVITMDNDQRIIPNGVVAIRGRRIVDVGASDIGSVYTASRTIDAGGAPCHPGLIESHIHATYQTLRSVMADHMHEDSVWDLVEQPFYEHVSSADEFASAAHAAIEMVRNGTTCFLEAGTALDPAALAKGAELVGIRAVIGDAFIWDTPHGFAMGENVERQQTPRIDRAPRDLAEALDRLGGELSRNCVPNTLVRGHVAVLGLGTASEELLLRAKACADRAGTVLNLHQSYSPADTEADRRRFGKAPLVHLAEIGVLDRNVTLAHANHLTDAECDAVAATGATLVWAPAASMLWGHGGIGSSRHAELWHRGANIALGSDSPNWSNDFDLFKQASLAVLTSRDVHGQRDLLVAEDGLFMATRGGARAVGLEDDIGSLEVGKLADVVVHTLDRSELHPRTNMVRNLLYSARSKSVSTVIIDGKVVLDGGRFSTLDAASVNEEVNDRSTDLLKRMQVRVEGNRIDRRERNRHWLR